MYPRACITNTVRIQPHVIPLASYPILNIFYAFTVANLSISSVKHPRFRVMLVLTPCSLVVAVPVLCFAALLTSVAILIKHNAAHDRAVGRLPGVYFQASNIDINRLINSVVLISSVMGYNSMSFVCLELIDHP
jgi:hypothetical protein